MDSISNRVSAFLDRAKQLQQNPSKKQPQPQSSPTRTQKSPPKYPQNQKTSPGFFNVPRISTPPRKKRGISPKTPTTQNRSPRRKEQPVRKQSPSQSQKPVQAVLVQKKRIIRDFASDLQRMLDGFLQSRANHFKQFQSGNKSDIKALLSTIQYLESEKGKIGASTQGFEDKTEELLKVVQQQAIGMDRKLSTLKFENTELKANLELIQNQPLKPVDICVQQQAITEGTDGQETLLDAIFAYQWMLDSILQQTEQNLVDFIPFLCGKIQEQDQKMTVQATQSQSTLVLQEKQIEQLEQQTRDLESYIKPPVEEKESFIMEEPDPIDIQARLIDSILEQVYETVLDIME